MQPTSGTIEQLQDLSLWAPEGCRPEIWGVPGKNPPGDIWDYFLALSIRVQELVTQETPEAVRRLVEWELPGEGLGSQPGGNGAVVVLVGTGMARKRKA